MLTTDTEAAAARERLSVAFSQNLARLDDVINREDYGVLFLGFALPLLRAAFEELLGDGERERVFDGIRALSLEALNRHGLYGAQLELKLAATEQHYARFEVAVRSGLSTPATQRLAATRQGKWLRSFDAWLKSVLDAAGLGSALDEFKKMAEEAVDDEPDPRWLGGGRGIAGP